MYLMEKVPMRKLALLVSGLATASSVASADYYANPRIRNTAIWADTQAEGDENADHFCQEQGDGEHLSWGYVCGEDENTYIDWRDGAWVTRDSGSTNYEECSLNGDGYPLLQGLRCGYSKPTAVTSSGATRRINGDDTSADQACRERGRASHQSYQTEPVPSGTTSALWWMGDWADYTPSPDYRIIASLMCR
jgi:hypothetical protein